MIPFTVNRILSQVRPANTTAATAYTRGTKQIAHISHIVICNTTAAAETFRIFIDSDGTTYDQTTALYYDKAIDANGTVFVDIDATIEHASGTVGVRTSTGNALTFTVIGEIKDII